MGFAAQTEQQVSASGVVMVALVVSAALKPRATLVDAMPRPFTVPMRLGAPHWA